jgi:hypothetical protein
MGLETSVKARQVGLLLLASSLLGSKATAFDNYEHHEIGNAAFALAIAQFEREAPGKAKELFSSRHLNNGVDPIGAASGGKEIARYSLGDLIAIYGDYAQSVTELNSTEFNKRGVLLKPFVRGRHLESPPGEQDHMIKLATNNATHFSRRAAQEYVQWHRKAMLLARDRKDLWEALHYEALGLHSFTDLFAFGHMLENRQLTDRVFKWADKEESKTGLSLSSRASLATTGGSVMGGYTAFYHHARNWRGAKLQNLDGDVWWGYGDNRYRIVDKSCDISEYPEDQACSDKLTIKQRDVIVKAVATSLMDILRIAGGKRLTIGTEYKAMCKLPVKYSEANDPIDLFDQKRQVAKLAVAMRANGDRIEDHGYDFSLGYLKYKTETRKGEVEYTDYIREFCAN